MVIAVAELERRNIPFDCAFTPGAIAFPDWDWKQLGDLWADGEAELLDRRGTRTIRVRGKIRGLAEGACSRCLRAVAAPIEREFDLFYYPMPVIERSGETRIGSGDTEIGFYEEEGIELRDVIGEQAVLSLPARALCGENCRGICPMCGALNKKCSCKPSSADSRWDGLRNLKVKRKQ